MLNVLNKTNIKPNAAANYIIKDQIDQKKIWKNKVTNLFKDFNNNLTTKEKIELVQNPNTHYILLEKIYNGKTNFDINQGLALNLNTPLYILKNLSKSKDSKIRARVAANASIDLKLLSTFSKDINEWVRASVISNPVTPIEILRLFKNDHSELVRYNLVNNPKLLKEDLESMLNDSKSYVLESIIQILNKFNKVEEIKETIEIKEKTNFFQTLIKKFL